MVTPYTWIDHFLACMGGCFGCCTKSTPIIAVDEPTKGLRIQGRAVKKPSISDDFWSTSTCDLENSAVQSQRSISSISTSNQTLNHCSGTSSNSDFVNHGLILWNQVRMQWIGSSKSENRTQQSWESKSRCLPLLLFLYSFLKLLSGNSVESTAYFHLTNTALPLCVHSIYISFD
ncbi:hypothetical protein CICLE_v10009673mg [Citrus x clementina]|uniref:Gag1-like clamp domain-containing protein n=2 Tax=Citrus TaxID=2706 RepID=A0A067GKV2_CITSI|nr:hypothetical protein CICLE_v10009673mg [Citrus x clementina]KDO80239.1 hypothetical protein CISIN_1g030646mg [Citrus sinensis]